MFDFEKTIFYISAPKAPHKLSKINITRPQNVGTGIQPHFNNHPFIIPVVLSW